MTYDDFMKILDNTDSMIISKELFKTLIDSQTPGSITKEEKKRIYDDGTIEQINEGEYKDETNN